MLLRDGGNGRALAEQGGSATIHGVSEGLLYDNNLKFSGPSYHVYGHIIAEPPEEQVDHGGTDAQCGEANFRKEFWQSGVIDTHAPHRGLDPQS